MARGLKFLRLTAGLAVIPFAALFSATPALAAITNAPNLGAAANFAVLAGTALTCTDSNVAGTVGVDFTTAFASTRCKMQVQYAPSAYGDFLTAYGNIANSLGCTSDNTYSTLAGLTLGPGTYCVSAAATMTGGTLTLIGGGPWIFEIGTTGGALTATNFTVSSDNPCNAYWWVQADTTLTTSAFQGTILGGGAITMTGTSLAGRALATGAVTMTGSNVFGCSGGTVAKQHCNQGVGNGPEGCDPGNSNNKNSSNDENGGTPGNPGRQGAK